MTEHQLIRRVRRGLGEASHTFLYHPSGQPVTQIMNLQLSAPVDVLESATTDNLTSSATVNHEPNVLAQFFSHSYITDIIDRNPMDKVPRPKARKDEEIIEEPPTYTIEDVHEIFKKISKEPLKWRAYIHLIASTGIRRGEACGLKWEHVDFSTNTITIAGNLCYTPKKGVYYDTTKGKRRRTVIVAPESMALLAELKASSEGLSEFVFTQDGGKLPMHPQSPTWYMKKIEKRYDIPDFHHHKLRHTFASISIEQGGKVTGVADALGHKDSSTSVRRYIHGSTKAQMCASQAVHNAIYGNTSSENAK